jgi:hypothetical protein
MKQGVTRRDKQVVTELVLEMAKTGPVTWKRLNEAGIRNYITAKWGGVIKMQKELGLTVSSWGGSDADGGRRGGVYKRRTKEDYSKPKGTQTKVVWPCRCCGKTFTARNRFTTRCDPCKQLHAEIYSPLAEGFHI